MGHPKGTADDAPQFGEKRERSDPDFSISDIYVEDGEVWIQTGGIHEPYNVEVAKQIRDHLDSAIEKCEE
jgi:hypothetical protein